MHKVKKEGEYILSMDLCSNTVYVIFSFEDKKVKGYLQVLMEWIKM